MGCGASTQTIKPKKVTLDKVTEDNLERELEPVLKEENKSDFLKNAIKEIVKCIETGSIDGDFLQMLAKPLSLAAMIASSIDSLQFGVTIAALSFAFEKVCNALGSLTRDKENNRTYTELQLYEDSELRTIALGLEELLTSKAVELNEIHNSRQKNEIDTIQDNIASNESIMFLGKLKGKTQDLLLKSDEMSARRAIAYVNLYSRIAIVRNLVLWQLYCIKRENDCDQLSIKRVSLMITNAQKRDIEMITSVTKVTIEKAVFLSVFNPTENEDFVCLLQVHGQENKIPRLDKRKGFTDRHHNIRSPHLPDMSMGMYLEMPRMPENCIFGTYANSDKCDFSIEPVKGRELDNIFYLKSTRYENYVYMKGDGHCYPVNDRPNSEGQWKLVNIKDGTGHPKFIISTLDRPVRFLYISSGWTGWWLAGTTDISEARKNGLWEIINI